MTLILLRFCFSGAQTTSITILDADDQRGLVFAKTRMTTSLVSWALRFVCESMRNTAGSANETARTCMGQRGYTLVQKDQAEEVRAAHATAAQRANPPNR